MPVRPGHGRDCMLLHIQNGRHRLVFSNGSCVELAWGSSQTLLEQRKGKIMNKWIFLAVLFAGLTMLAPARAEPVPPGCLPVEGDLQWTLPTEPIGPSWSFVAVHDSEYGDGDKLRVTFWRWPCNATDSQLILTLTPLQGQLTFISFSIKQRADVWKLLFMLINDPSVHIGNELPFMGAVLSGKAVSGVVGPGIAWDRRYDDDFDPSASMDIGFATVTGGLPKRVLSIPAYNPAAYGIEGSSRFTIDNSVTGTWYSPAQSGHGFMLMVLPGNRLLAQWYTFAPDGTPMWILGDGYFSGDEVVLQAYTTGGPGALFPPYFDMDEIERTAWGTFTFEFQDCHNAVVEWDPTVPGFSPGSMSIRHLAVPDGLSCAD